MAKKKNTEKVSQKEAEKLVEKGDANIPPEAIVSNDETIKAEKAKTQYQDHMGSWESKSEKAKAKKSSEVDIDYSKHPKFHKFKAKAEGAK